jgi:CubicO group peptidase (beta-lactamase class C family)
MRQSKSPRLGPRSLLLLIFGFVVLASTGCAGSCRRAPSAEQLASVRYTPQQRDDWEVSTPPAQGLDPKVVRELFWDAGQLEDIDSLLLVKNGQLVAEAYFHDGSIDATAELQSVTKSYTSALVGIALDRGCLKSVDQKMMEFFPEFAEKIRDPRKNSITIRDLLQMRAGYPWEESNGELFAMLYSGLRPRHLVETPLNRDPGTVMEYSNLSSHILGIIVARACDTDIAEFAAQYLHQPMGVTPGDWMMGWEDYRFGMAGLKMRARDLAKFGQLYLDDGRFAGKAILPAQWVHDSLQSYSDRAWRIRVGPNWTDPHYGYQWWAVTAGAHRYNLAWGHGGQQIALVHDLDLVVVVTSDPLIAQHGGGPWRREKANLNLVADFIAKLPPS